MGTNFYLYDKPPCAACARPYEAKHIGKSSAGWCFTLHVIPEDGINDLPDWERLWSVPGAEIRDECGVMVTVREMHRIITDRWLVSRADLRTPSYYEINDAEPGPNGLMRHRIGRHCIGYGEGTWDLIPGEFS